MAAILVLAQACQAQASRPGHSPSPRITATASPISSGSPAATATTTPTAAATPNNGPTLLPMQTAQGGEFLSPTGNISCEVDFHRNGATSAYCQTETPPRSVTMNVAGTYTTCTGEKCLGNPGIDTPTLAYGTATGVGAFVCESATTGVTCTANGRGFQISTSGIRPV